jgi:hypothetical protein
MAAQKQSLKHSFDHRFVHLTDVDVSVYIGFASNQKTYLVCYSPADR